MYLSITFRVFLMHGTNVSASSIAVYSPIRQDLTTDPEVLETVTGQNIELDTRLKQLNPLQQPKFSDIQASCALYWINLKIQLYCNG